MMREKRELPPKNERIIEPFKLFGNVYFVGSYGESSHVIDTGAGLVMIDTGSTPNLQIVLSGLEKLGFAPTDVKYIINSHWHHDHTEATKAMAELSGAKTLIGREDYEKAKRFFDADILVSEGNTLTLGNTTFEFIETPGHTKGTLSIFFNAEDDGKTVRAGMFGGAGVNTLHQGKFDYEGCREDYRKSVRRLMNEPVELFIGNHSWNNHTYEKWLDLVETGENHFVSHNAWLRFLESCERRLDETIAKDTI